MRYTVSDHFPSMPALRNGMASYFPSCRAAWSDGATAGEETIAIESQSNFDEDQ